MDKYTDAPSFFAFYRVMRVAYEDYGMPAGYGETEIESEVFPPLAALEKIFRDGHEDFWFVCPQCNEPIYYEDLEDAFILFCPSCGEAIFDDGGAWVEG